MKIKKSWTKAWILEAGGFIIALVSGYCESVIGLAVGIVFLAGGFFLIPTPAD